MNCIGPWAPAELFETIRPIRVSISMTAASTSQSTPNRSWAWSKYRRSTSAGSGGRVRKSGSTFTGEKWSYKAPPARTFDAASRAALAPRRPRTIAASR
jgi:hypothetical protein